MKTVCLSADVLPFSLFFRSTNDEITHIIHISKALPPLDDSIELQDLGMDEVV